MEANNHRLMIRIDQVQPSVESLEEMTVHTSNFAAEYGQVAGGIFNLTAKSGTNTLRGSLFEYYVNEKFGAGIPFTNDGTGKLVKPPNRRNNFGGSLGGPVTIPGVYNGRNRTFFFYSFEQFRPDRNAQRASADDADRSDAERRLRRGVDGPRARHRSARAADHGERDLRSAHDARRSTDRWCGDPFPNNVIPRELLDPVALKIQDYIPQGDAAGTDQQLGSVVSRRHDQVDRDH